KTDRSLFRNLYDDSIVNHVRRHKQAFLVLHIFMLSAQGQQHIHMTAVSVRIEQDSARRNTADFFIQVVLLLIAFLNHIIHICLI
ncbi:MAG: hypothetical protein IJ181_02325, partial [Acidaminococcaceae bacterium]|nr:hypothetical protein [Acidaminococcaceae bacterium]